MGGREAVPRAPVHPLLPPLLPPPTPASWARLALGAWLARRRLLALIAQ